MSTVPVFVYRIAITLCLAGQGVFLWHAASQATRLRGVGIWLVCAAITCVVAVVLWRRGGRRTALAGLLALQVLSLLPLSTVIRLGAQDDEQWLLDRQADLENAVAVRAEQVRDGVLGGEEWLTPEVVAEAPDEPFALLGILQRRAGRDAPDFPVALALWQRGERIAWNEGIVSLPPPRDGIVTDGFRLYHSGENRIWRRFHDVVTAAGDSLLLEVQRGLIVRREDTHAVSAWTDWRDGDPFVRTRVVEEAGAGRRVWWGDADRGVQLTVDIVLSDNSRQTVGQRLRLTAVCPPRLSLADRAATHELFRLLLLWGLAVVAAGAACGGRIGLVVAIVLVRIFWLRIELFRWLQAGSTGPELSALPNEVGSLLDPAYFATPVGGGWLASTAEALLSVFMLVALAWLAHDLLTRRPPRGGASPSWRVVRAFGFGLLATLLLCGLRVAIGEIVVNANPRLIGVRVPVSSWAFWALQTLLLLMSGTVLYLLSLLAARWRATIYRSREGLLVAASALAMMLLWPGLPLFSRFVAVLIAVVLWVLAAVLAGGRGARLRTVLVAPLLLTVAWNYICLAETYRNAELAWLDNKADEIVESADDWIAFLMEDHLAEMAGGIDDGDADSPHSPLADQLWRNRAAYDLWLNSAIRDLGRPCLVEVLDAEGQTTSLFASGFLRDFSYEVVHRSEWEEASAPVGEVADFILVQTERRRYPTGEEEVLRGEVKQRRGDGWIRLELPVRSKRLTTLLARLSGLPAMPGGEGYRPRSDVDAMPLLVRCDAGGWLDSEPGGYPDDTSLADLAVLQTGEAEHAIVTVDGRRYRCVWRHLPAAEQRRPDDGFLLGLPLLPLLERILDISRLALVYFLLLTGPVLVVAALRLLRQRRLPRLGFQERFLAGYLVLGLLLLLLAGMFFDQRTLSDIETDARRQTREGLTSALGQLQGMLSEQARSLAASDYVADLLRNRLAGERPIGPFALRQGMVFSGDGELLLDETLSNLSEAEAAALLAAARSAPLIVVEEGDEAYLGTIIPIDLSGIEDPSAEGLEGETRDRRLDDGFFFYRQRVGDDLISGLADIVQGEVTLRVGGEAVLASHPERVFSGRTAVFAPPAMVRGLRHEVTTPLLFRNATTSLDLTGCVGLPGLGEAADGTLSRRRNPAILSVEFPARQRELTERRRETILFLTGLASLILLTSALLTILLTWNIFGPVRMLVTATRRLAGGDFAAPLPDGGADEVGVLAASFGQMRDSLRRARAELAGRERFLTTVLDRVPVGVVVLDPRDEVVVLNIAARRILQRLRVDDETAETGDEAGDGEIGQEDVAWLLAGCRRLVAPHSAGGGELTGPHRRRTLRWRLAPLEREEAPGGVETLLVFEDVTEFLANKRLALNAEMARQVAHEIKNPLTPIQLSVQFLQQAWRDRSPDLESIVDKTVQQVLEQVTLLRTIAGEFSLLGRPGRLECASLDLRGLVEKVVGGYLGAEEAVGPRVEIESGPVPPVLAHADSLVKVLGNLMQNSIDASGGAAQLHLHIDWLVTPGDVTLVWTDNGSGLSADVAEHLFDPYFSTKSKGTGLGLPICRNLVDKMGGRLTLANRRDGHGAEACLVLPRAESDDLATPDEA